MSQFLPSHQLLARSSTNEPDAQIPLVDVNGSPRFVGNLGTASSGRRRDDVDGDRFPSPPGAGSSRTRRHAHRSHPNGSPRGKNRLHAAKQPRPGGGGFLLPLFPGVISPLPHLTPHHINFASPPRVRRARSVTGSPGRRESPWPSDQAPNLRGFNSITRSPCARVTCGVAVATPTPSRPVVFELRRRG